MHDTRSLTSKLILRRIVLVAAVFASSGCASLSSKHADAPRANAGERALPTMAPSPSTGRMPAAGADQDHNAMVVGLYGEGDDWRAPSSPAGGRANLTQVSFAPEGGDFSPDLDRSGQMLVYASRQHSAAFDIYRKSVDGRTVTQITNDPADDMMPAVSPDGRSIAFVSNRNGNWDVFVTPIEGGPPIQVTRESDDEVQPSWSPDGRTLAFARRNQRSGRWEIWTAEATAAGSTSFLCEGFLPRWCPSPTSSKILFQRARQQGSRLYGVWTVDIVDGQATNPTEIVSAQNAAVIQPNWSPDGSRIVFTTVVDPGSQNDEFPAASDLWIVNIDGTGRTSLTDGRFRNMQPVWGTDGRVYFVSDRGGIENIWSIVPGEGGSMMGHGSSSGSIASGATTQPNPSSTAQVGEGH